MQPATLLTIAIAATASASLLPRQDASSGSSEDPMVTYAMEVCYPGLAQYQTSSNWDDLDLTAPCNAIANMTWACAIGSQYTGASSSSDDSSGDPPEFANSTQRDCLCSSQFWSLTQGCQDCLQAHGFPEFDLNTPPPRDSYYVPSSVISSLSASYCAASNTPTVDVFDLFETIYPDNVDTTDTASLPTATSTFSDPLGSTATAVSYYYTPAVSGSAVVFVPEETILPTSSGASLSLSLSTDAAGQIVPTAGKAADLSTTTGGATKTSAVSSSMSTSGGTAARVFQQAAGVVAFAGMVAML